MQQALAQRECGRHMLCTFQPTRQMVGLSIAELWLSSVGAGMIIDARVKGNVARLLNSSCDPNCETQKWHDAGNGEVSQQGGCSQELVAWGCGSRFVTCMQPSCIEAPSPGSTLSNAALRCADPRGHLHAA